MRHLYTLGILFYGLGIRIAANFNKKAKQWVAGRKGGIKSQTKLQNPIWFHCASLGEFEQGRPLIEEIKRKNPNQPILLSFFSPSGYTIRKDYAQADSVVYLPLDTPKNMARFIDYHKPKAAYFVKYEIWHNCFEQLFCRKIPLYLVSAIFRENQVYFKPFGGWFRSTLRKITHIYTQDENSQELLDQIGVSNTTCAGDTRFDRVLSLAESAKNDAVLTRFCAGGNVLVGGSTWAEDERILEQVLDETPDWKLLLAPHEINEAKISKILARRSDCIKWSDSPEVLPHHRILIIDTIGLLGAAYKLGHAAFIGGGFGKGIHNTLEAAVYGLPVFFGPNYEKFNEAKELIAKGGGMAFETETDAVATLKRLLVDTVKLTEMGQNAKEMVLKNAGATSTILNNSDI